MLLIKTQHSHSLVDGALYYRARVHLLALDWIMKLSIYSIKQTLLETEAEKVTLPTPQGEITVLDRHVPLITLVKEGAVSYYTSEGQWQEIMFPGGIAEIRPGSELVLLAQEKI